MVKTRKRKPSGKPEADSKTRPADSSYWQQLGRGLIRSMHLDGHPQPRN